jgi:hypothetical protein
MGRLLRPTLLRIPDRRFVSVAGGGHGTHEVARFCHRHRARLALVSEPRPDANPFGLPPPHKARGGRGAKGGGGRCCAPGRACWGRTRS